MTFKVGDRVLLAAHARHAVKFKDIGGLLATLIQVDDGEDADADGMPYQVDLGFGDTTWLLEHEIESLAPAPVSPVAPVLPEGWRMYYANTSQRRKEQPVTEGFLDYFPAVARLVAELSRLGNEKHNPGEPMHWARGKSKDHRDCTVRHVMDADEIDPETQLAEAVAAVWRASAYLQLLAEEKYGWPKAPRAR
jgi:hypothetical protein